MKTVLVVLCLVMLGCGSAPMHQPQWTTETCQEAGGVMYKGPLSRKYECVDKDSLRQALRNAGYH